MLEMKQEKIDWCTCLHGREQKGRNDERPRRLRKWEMKISVGGGRAGHFGESKRVVNVSMVAWLFLSLITRLVNFWTHCGQIQILFNRRCIPWNIRSDITVKYGKMTSTERWPSALWFALELISFWKVVAAPTQIALLEHYDGKSDFQSAMYAAAATVRDISGGGEREVTRFFFKRIPCSCLNNKYSQVSKDHPNKNATCDHCIRNIERETLMVCSRCRLTQYCSRACQVANWPNHKSMCDAHYHWK